MKVNKVVRAENTQNNLKLTKAYISIEDIIEALNKKEVPIKVSDKINALINEINTFSGDQKTLLKLIKKVDKEIVVLIEKELGWVKKAHYQSLWTAFGMMGGIIFSTIVTQLGYEGTWSSVGVGVSIGLVFGLIAGKNRDAKAEKDGFQLDV